MIRRHSPAGIFMHWFNAACWLILSATGLGLIDNPALQPLGMWWVELWRALGFDGKALLAVHAATGLVWAAVWAVFCLTRWRRETGPFLGRTFRFSPLGDAVWLRRKVLLLAAGEKFMRARGLDTSLPEQGFYNAGQKAFAVLVVCCGLGLAVTGAAALVSRLWAGGQAAVQWSLAVHFLCAVLTAVGLPVHVYMAALAPGEGPALRSMFTGFVPREYVRHHNPLWFRQLSGERGPTPPE